MLTVLVYGDAGVGKSRLAASAPAPRLHLDVEGRGHYLPGTSTTWDVLRDEPPADDGSWETCLARVRDFDTLTRAFQWLQSGQTPFASVAIDSLTEAQKRYIDKLVGLNQLADSDWGSVLRHLEKIVRDFRDLVSEPTNPVSCVTFICGETTEDGKRKPLLQGALRRNLAYLVDVCGYLYVSHDAENNIQRILQIQPSINTVAKDGTDRLGTGPLRNPDLAAMYAQVNQGVAA